MATAKTTRLAVAQNQLRLLLHSGKDVTVDMQCEGRGAVAPTRKSARDWLMKLRHEAGGQGHRAGHHQTCSDP